MEEFYLNMFVMLIWLIFTLYVNNEFLNGNLKTGIILFCVVISICVFTGVMEDFYLTIVLIILAIMVYNELSG